MLASLVGSSAPMPTMPTMCLKDKEELQKEQVYYSREQVTQSTSMNQMCTVMLIRG